MKRRAMSELPQTDDEVAQWCRDLFVAKAWFYLNCFIGFQETRYQSNELLLSLLSFLKWQDALLDKHIADGSFGNEVRPLGCPVKSLVVRKHFDDAYLTFLPVTFFSFLLHR
jgi:lysophosphatidic acid acyltransferase / lysophosphatidylinositol acyltransferase